MLRSHYKNFILGPEGAGKTSSMLWSDFTFIVQFVTIDCGFEF